MFGLKTPNPNSNGYVDASDRKLSKDEQKKIDELVAKRDAMNGKIDLQIQAIKDGKSDSKSGCCIILWDFVERKVLIW